MRDLGPKRFGFWGRMALTFKLAIRIGLPSLALLTLAGCDGGKRYLTLPAERAGSWGDIARDLCPTDLNLEKQLRELNFNEASPLNADTRWFSKLYSDVRIVIPEIRCEVPGKVESQPVPVPLPIPSPLPVPSHPDVVEQRDVVETAPDVAPEAQVDAPPPQPEVEDAAPTKVKPEGGHRPRPDAHSGGSPDAHSQPHPEVVIPI